MSIDYRKTHAFNYGYLMSSVENHIKDLEMLVPPNHKGKLAVLIRGRLDTLKKDLLTTKNNLK